AKGPEALGDLRRRNGASATILTPGPLDKLRLRLGEPPPDGGLWSSRKVAAWMAGELGLVSVVPQRGWRAESRVAGQSEAFRDSGLSGAAKARQALKAIGWSIQKPRPKNPKSATPEEAAAFKKSSRTRLPKRRREKRLPQAIPHAGLSVLFVALPVSASASASWPVCGAWNRRHRTAHTRWRSF
ncbi:MAG: hypothetical protein ACREDJ_05080, partial [Methylocella sp.]